MGGAVARSIAAVASLGTSEAFQETPFQNVTDQDRPTAGGGSAFRFGGAPIIGLSPLSAASPALAGATGQTESDPSATDEADRRREQALGEQRAAAQAEYTRYNTTPQSAQEEFASRRRATAARQSLGRGASSYLTSTLG